VREFLLFVELELRMKAVTRQKKNFFYLFIIHISHGKDNANKNISIKAVDSKSYK
jgi:hypothetical protein